MSLTKPVKATSTYWIRATVRGPFGTFQAKVAFGPEKQPSTGFVPPEVPGWNFSSLEHAEELAQYACMRVYPGLSGDCSLVTEVIEEQ